MNEKNIFEYNDGFSNTFKAIPYIVDYPNVINSTVRMDRRFKNRGNKKLIKVSGKLKLFNKPSVDKDKVNITISEIVEYLYTGRKKYKNTIVWDSLT